MKIVKRKDELNILFDYNPAIIQIVRNFKNRKFDNKKKLWTVHVSQIKEVLDILTPLGFKSSRDVLDDYDKEIKKRRKINRILSGTFKTTEIELFKKSKLPLYDFQKIGTGFLCVLKSGLVGDEPGLGKTLMSLGFVKIQKCQKNLILCPSSLKQQWKEEIDKWVAKKRAVIIKGTKKERDKAWKKETSFYIANYELLLYDLDKIKKIEWDTIIADEATRIANPKAQRTKNIKKIKTKYRIALTGTPLSNKVEDVWSIIDFCFPGYLGNYWQFLSEYCVFDKWNAVVAYTNLEKLKKILRYVMIRRKKCEVLHELPDRVYENIYVEISDKERKIYQAIKNELRNELKEFEVQRVLDDKYLSKLIVKMVRLRQAIDSLELVSNHTSSSKIDALKELLLDILQENKKALIFTEFKEFAKILYRELKEYNPLLFTGDTAVEDRDAIIKMFTNNDKNHLLISTSAGHEGLNLQKAEFVIHADLPWSIAKLEQREGRAHRVGQTNKITVFKLIAEKTIDEYIFKVLHKKQKLSDELFEDRKKKVKKMKLTRRDIERMLE